MDTATLPGQPRSRDGHRALPAAHIQHMRTRPHARLIHQTAAHVLEKLGAALVVPAGGLGEPGDDLMLDGPGQHFGCAHREVIASAAGMAGNGITT